MSVVVPDRLVIAVRSKNDEVVSRTSSGKPLYLRFRPKDYYGFTPDEHRNAFQIHRTAAMNMGRKAAKLEDRSKAARKHEVAARLSRLANVCRIRQRDHEVAMEYHHRMSLGRIRPTQGSTGRSGMEGTGIHAVL